MRVKYQFDIHLYDEQEKLIPDAVELYNIQYVLKITEFIKKGSRWHFTVDAEFPKDLTPEGIERMKSDTIFRIGWFITL